jgi:hypothetical protein
MTGVEFLGPKQLFWGDVASKWECHWNLLGDLIVEGFPPS